MVAPVRVTLATVNPMTGAQLPRKSTTAKNTRETVENAAIQIGIVVALERNRKSLNQLGLANEVAGGARQSSISRIERGLPARMTSQQIDKLFRTLDMNTAAFRTQRAFLKWWQQQ